MNDGWVIATSFINTDSEIDYIMGWCRNNVDCAEWFYCGRTQINNLTQISAIFEFKRETDAVAFRLKFND